MEKVSARYTCWQGSKASPRPHGTYTVCAGILRCHMIDGFSALMWPLDTSRTFSLCFMHGRASWKKVHEPTLTTYPCCTPQCGGVAGDPTEVSPVSLMAVYLQGGKICMHEVIKDYVIICKRIILCRVKYHGRNAKGTTCSQGGEVNLTNDLAWNKIKVNTNYLISSSGISSAPTTLGVLTVFQRPVRVKALASVPVAVLVTCFDCCCTSLFRIAPYAWLPPELH